MNWLCKQKNTADWEWEGKFQLEILCCCVRAPLVALDTTVWLTCGNSRSIYYYQQKFFINDFITHILTMLFTSPQGSDPRLVTTRGKLQSRRCKLNQVRCCCAAVSKSRKFDLNSWTLFCLAHTGNQQRTSITVSRIKPSIKFVALKPSNFNKSYSAGAENLYKATENKKLKEKINLELSFMNSTLQLLKEQLSELNSAVDVYQHEK